MKRTLKILFSFLVLMMLVSCSTILRPADNRNPCSLKYKMECEEWRQKFPKEYARYVERMKKYELQASTSRQ